jgi:hypothetical protein
MVAPHDLWGGETPNRASLLVVIMDDATDHVPLDAVEDAFIARLWERAERSRPDRGARDV